MKHMGPILKAARLKLGMSMNEVARVSGIPASSLSRLERGEIWNPTLLTMATVAQVYGIDPSLWFHAPTDVHQPESV